MFVIRQMLKLYPWRNNFHSIQFPLISNKHHSVISHHFWTSGEGEKSLYASKGQNLPKKTWKFLAISEPGSIPFFILVFCRLLHKCYITVDVLSRDLCAFIIQVDDILISRSSQV